MAYWSIAATCGFAGMLTLPILMSGASFSSIAACGQHPRDHTRLFAPVQVGPVQELKRRRAAWHCTRLLRPRTPYPGNPDMPSTQSVYPPPQKWYWIRAADVPSVAARPVLGYTHVSQARTEIAGDRTGQTRVITAHSRRSERRIRSLAYRERQESMCGDETGAHGAPGRTCATSLAATCIIL